MSELQMLNNVILDDGTYYVVLDTRRVAAHDAPGFLRKRCARGLHTPFGFDCVGQFRLTEQSGWTAEIEVRSDLDVGSEDFTAALGASRMDAICALWQARTYTWSRFS